MKHKKLIVTATATVAIITGLAVWLVVSNRHDSSTPQIISGKVTSISNECQADGTCSITLDGIKTIVTGCGLMADSKTCKIYDQSTLRIGQQVKATVVMGQSGSYGLDCDICTISPRN